MESHAPISVGDATSASKVAALRMGDNLSPGFRTRAFAARSWINAGRPFGFGHNGSTGVMTQWEKFKKTQQKNGVADPKLVCIDIAPYGDTQAPDRADILNIGGFRDAVFNVVSSFLESDQARFVREVESVEL